MKYSPKRRSECTKLANAVLRLSEIIAEKFYRKINGFIKTIPIRNALVVHALAGTPLLSHTSRD